jgi:hypothetical protein
MPAPWFPEPSASPPAVTVLVDKLESPMLPLRDGTVVPLALLGCASTSPATAPSSIPEAAALSVPFLTLLASVFPAFAFKLSPGLLSVPVLESAVESPAPSRFDPEASTAAPLFFLAFFLLGSEVPVPSLMAVDGVAVGGSGRF